MNSSSTMEPGSIASGRPQEAAAKLKELGLAMGATSKKLRS